MPSMKTTPGMEPNSCQSLSMAQTEQGLDQYRAWTRVGNSFVSNNRILKTKSLKPPPRGADRR
jgi:hypothetical protein